LRDEKFRARSNFALADVLGVDLEAEDRKYAYDSAGNIKEDVTAIYLESAGHPLAKSLAVSTVGVPGSFLRVRCKTAQEVMRFRLPLMVEEMEKTRWFNWGPPPPGGDTVPFAVTLNRFGKGQALYVGVQLFRAMNTRPFWIQKWVPELVRSLAPGPVFELNSQPSSEYVHATYFYDKSRKFVLVQVVNAVELATNGELRTVPKVEIRFNPQKLGVQGAKVVWPSERPLALQRNSVVLENVGRYTALLLKVG
jgi:hypothetical protein